MELPSCVLVQVNHQVGMGPRKCGSYTVYTGKGSIVTLAEHILGVGRQSDDLPFRPRGMKSLAEYANAVPTAEFKDRPPGHWMLSGNGWSAIAQWRGIAARKRSASGRPRSLRICSL